VADATGRRCTALRAKNDNDVNVRKTVKNSMTVLPSEIRRKLEAYATYLLAQDDLLA